MSDHKNPNDELTSKLLSDVSEIAKKDADDSEGFLKSLTSLAESDEYSEIADKMEEKALKEEPATISAESFFAQINASRFSGTVMAEEDDLKDLSRTIGKNEPAKKDRFSDFELNLKEAEIKKEEKKKAEEAKKDEVLTKSAEEIKAELQSGIDLPEDFEERLESLKTPEPVLENKSDEISIISEKIAEVEKADSEKITESVKEAEPVNSEKTTDSEITEEKPEKSQRKSKKAEKKNEPLVEEVETAAAESVEENKASSDENAESSETEEKPKNKKKNIIYTLMMIACIGVFCYCVGRIVIYYYTGYKYKQSNKKLQEIVGDISQDVVIKDPEVIVETDIFFPDELVYATTSSTIQFDDTVSENWQEKYKNLVELNPDCIGWIKIPDTEINLPVMYTPEDYEKYLYKNFEGEYLYRGLPFMAENTLLNKSQNYIIYGHNMNDGTAFANLKMYLDQSWANEHKYCYFNTAYAEGVYELMDVVITKIYNVDDECFKYYKYTGELTEDDFNTYVYYMDQMSKFDTGVDAVWGDQLLSLSTCYRIYDPEGRLVIVFKRIQ